MVELNKALVLAKTDIDRQAIYNLERSVQLAPRRQRHLKEHAKDAEKVTLYQAEQSKINRSYVQSIHCDSCSVDADLRHPDTKNQVKENRTHFFCMSKSIDPCTGV